MNNLKHRIASGIGWTIDQVNQFSLQTLREIVQDPLLKNEISRVIQSGEYIREAPVYDPYRELKRLGKK